MTEPCLLVEDDFSIDPAIEFKTVKNVLDASAKLLSQD